MKPIEKLYLISKEKEEVYSLKNKLYCLLYQLVENKNIIFKGSKFKISLTGKDFNSNYESIFADILKDKKYIELDSFIKNIHFQPSLVKEGYLEEKPSKNFLSNIFGKKTEVRTDKYLQFQLDMNKEIKEKIDLLDILCPKNKYKLDILRLYNNIINGIKEAEKEEKQ